MRPRNELTIRGAGPELARLLEALERPLAGGWRRYVEAEARLCRLGLPGSGRCLACTAEANRPAAALWLEPRGGDEIHVADIVTLGQRALSNDEYNRILADFDLQVLQPICEVFPVQTALTPSRVEIEAQLSLEAIHRLKAFSTAANKASLHPTDRLRWREFILQVHVEGADFDPLLLDQWLAEQGWAEEQRQYLVSEYETARSILMAYDEERLEKCLP